MTTNPLARIGISSRTIVEIREWGDVEHTSAIAQHDQFTASEPDDRNDIRYCGHVLGLALLGTCMALCEEPDDPQPVPIETIDFNTTFQYHSPSYLGLMAWQVLQENVMIGPDVMNLRRLPIYQPHTNQHVALNDTLRKNALPLLETIDRLETKREAIQNIAQRGNAASEVVRITQYLEKELTK